MKKSFFSLTILTLIIVQISFAQTFSLSVKTWVPEGLSQDFKSTGRIFLFVSESQRSQPRMNTWPGGSNNIYAINITDWQPGEQFIFDGTKNLTSSTETKIDELPEGKYRVQVLWDQNREASQINAPGNLYSEAKTVELNENTIIELPLKEIIPPLELAKHELLEEVDITSEVLSEWWEKEVRLKAAVFLPRSFFDEPDRKYPVRYNIAGYGGRYTRAARMLDHIDWWTSDDAPEVINVFLDGEGPFGDSYQLNSENSGPYGTALIEELIPHIEEKYRGIGTPESRFLDGCSTGGWVSLALQLFYPDFFGGCFSYSPDPVDFHHFQLIDIYDDKNAFLNEYDYLRPVARNITGEPIISFKDFIQCENVQGWSDTYITSGGQFSAFTALYSPKGKDGLPAPLFDPHTGIIDHDVAEHWIKYDLKHYVESNWELLGPKLEHKIWIWGADMDNFYLNPALRSFDEMLQKKESPKSNAVIIFTPMTGHCEEYSDLKVLKQIQTKLQQPD